MGQVCPRASEHFTDKTKTCPCESRCLVTGILLYVGMAQIAKERGEDSAISDDSREPTTRPKAADNLPKNQELGKYCGPVFMRVLPWSLIGSFLLFIVVLGVLGIYVLFLA